MTNADAPSKEVSHILETLNGRLAKAEAELAGRRGNQIPEDTGGRAVCPPSTAESKSKSRGSEASSERLSDTAVTSPQEISDFIDHYIEDQAYRHHKDKDMERVSKAARVTAPRKWEIDESNTIPQVLINELSENYFDSVQYYFPIINKSRYVQKIEILPYTHELKSLNYAIWSHGALCSNKHEDVEQMCYLHSRSLLEQVEIASGGTNSFTIVALQACLLIAVYEIKRMYFTRAWITAGRALRLAQILKLHLIDSGPGKVPPKDSLHSEEGRTAFWVAFIIDRCMTNGQDWPMIIEHNLTMIRLPSAEDAGADAVQPAIARYQATPCLEDYLANPFPPQMPLFAYVAVATAVWGRCMKHFHESSRNDAHMVTPADFWTRHHGIQNHVMQISTAAGLLPTTPHSPNPNAIFLSMMLHTISIYLYHSAASYGLMTGLAVPLSPDSDGRCDAAAMEIAGSARAFSALNLYSKMNLFAAQCLYAAARVLVESIKSLRGDARSLDSLHTILGAMDAWKRENPLVELYIKRISQDLEGDEISGLMLMPY